MFSGLIEFRSQISAVSETDAGLQVQVVRPAGFPEDLKIGDSIAVSGVCLTLEKFSQTHLFFILGAETRNLTKWSARDLLNKKVHVEPSIRLGDRIHGHLVSGHVDEMGKVLETHWDQGSFRLRIEIPEKLRSMVWPKASVALNGVSLTVNQVWPGESFDLCLIPETLKKTELGQLQVGNRVCIEVDPIARGVVHVLENLKSQKTGDL